jgi:hypothetical protein
MNLFLFVRGNIKMNGIQPTAEWLFSEEPPCNRLSTPCHIIELTMWGSCRRCGPHHRRGLYSRTAFPGSLPPGWVSFPNMRTGICWHRLSPSDKHAACHSSSRTNIRHVSLTICSPNIPRQLCRWTARNHLSNAPIWEGEPMAFCFPRCTGSPKA